MLPGVCDDETTHSTPDVTALGLHPEAQVAASSSAPFSRRTVLRVGSVAVALSVL